MEKILRKVSVEDKLPEYFENVLCLYHIGNSKTKNIPVYRKAFLYYDEDNKWYDVHTSLELEYAPDYWYEEVDIDEILKETMSKPFAKERYEKALSFVLNSRDMSRVPRQILNEEMYKALRIAAGLDEEEI